MVPSMPLTTQKSPQYLSSVIKASLIEVIHTSDEMSDGTMDKATLRWKKIEEYLKTHDYIMNADVRGVVGNGESNSCPISN